MVVTYLYDLALLAAVVAVVWQAFTSERTARTEAARPHTAPTWVLILDDDLTGLAEAVGVLADRDAVDIKLWEEECSG